MQCACPAPGGTRKPWNRPRLGRSIRQLRKDVEHIVENISDGRRQAPPPPPPPPTPGGRARDSPQLRRAGHGHQQLVAARCACYSISMQVSECLLPALFGRSATGGAVLSMRAVPWPTEMAEDTGGSSSQKGHTFWICGMPRTTLKPGGECHLGHRETLGTPRGAAAMRATHPDNDMSGQGQLRYKHDCCRLPQ